MILNDTKLKNKLIEISQRNPEISDIILFGSVVRGKEKPGDIDIIVIFKNKIYKNTEYDIRKEIEKRYNNVSTISKTEETALEKTFDARESILFEGRSLITGKNLAEKYGFSAFGMFKYSFGDWNKLQKTKFYHALNGRGNKKGVADALNCIKLSDSLMLTPLEKIEEFREFLEFWNVKYIYLPTLLPERLGKKRIVNYL